jgi:hypothetical protein
MMNEMSRTMPDDTKPTIRNNYPWHHDPENWDFPWAKDFERVRANSKQYRGSTPILASDMPKIPINLQLAVMAEATARPEIMAAYGSAPLNGQIPEQACTVLFWFEEYLSHKYGDRPEPARTMTVYMRKLMNGVYSGLDDPSLIRDLKTDPFVGEDDGVEYG